MELLVWSISNPLRGFSHVIAGITSHSCLRRIPMSYLPLPPTAALLHRLDWAAKLSLLLLERKLRAGWVICWGVLENLEGKYKVLKFVWKAQRFSSFVSFLIKQVFHLSCWYESWEMTRLLPHLHSRETNSPISHRPFHYTSSHLTWNNVVSLFTAAQIYSAFTRWRR